MGNTRHLAVLLRKTHGAVNENKAHIRPLHGHFGPEIAVVLNGVLDLGLFPQPRRVDEGKGSVWVFNGHIHRVPGGSGHVRDDAPVLPGHPVHQRGLAHIGLADDSHLNDLAFGLLFLPLGQAFQHPVQQVAGAVAVDRGYHHRVPQAQVIELVKLRGGLAHAVAFVHAQHHRAAAFLQQLGHLLVCGGNPGTQVRDENNGAGRVNGNLHLLPHLAEQNILRGGLQAPGIHQGEGPAAPFPVPENPVPGHAGGVLHNGQPPPHNFVE